jgi:hypothetical protein
VDPKRSVKGAWPATNHHNAGFSGQLRISDSGEAGVSFVPAGY